MSEEELEEKVTNMIWNWEDSGESYRDLAKRILILAREFYEKDDRE